jgi:predicted Zn finger-like uncharacterized protein
MFGGRAPAYNSFTCPNCQALYHVVKVEAAPETVFQEVPCRVCGQSLAGREGKFVLKYFLLRKAAPVRKARRTRSVARQ